MKTPKRLGSVTILVALVAVLYSAPVRLPLPHNGPEITLLLVGATGNGRSALGNHIVGRSMFDSRPSARMVTKHTKVTDAEIGSRKLLVVDTPGLLGNQDMVDTRDVVESLKSSFQLSPKGYSAFLVVMNQANRVTTEQIYAVKILQIVFGDDFFKHAIFVFTHKDQYEGYFNAYYNVAEAFRSYIDNQPDDMADFIHRADDRVMFVNSLEINSVVNRDFQINLIHMVDDMTRGSRYTKEHFDNAHEFLKEEIQHKLKKAEKERQEEEKLIWDKAIETCNCPSHDSEYTFNFNIHILGSDYVNIAVDYLFGGIQKILGWVKPPPPPKLN